ncbi:hypothetical protein [Sneathiella glossodoripedis]|uniref:hypothetical protein n=1 Tax=Sneathiella glossodoripedis TaxID=418853 RepID=UPI00046F5160|nr:hypothetical protein [Sneathiella glossodoripedis]
MLKKTKNCASKWLANDSILTTEGIDFILDPSERFVTSRYARLITDETIVADYQLFFESGLWKPGINELVDARDPSVLKFGAKGLSALANYAAEFLASHQVTDSLSAIYAPHPLPHGLARMYQAVSEKSSHRTRIFADFNEAIDWLLTNSSGPRT